MPENVNITAFNAKFGGFSGTAGTVTLKVGDTTVGTGSLNATSDVTVSSTTTVNGKVLTVTVTGISKGVKCYNISYTYSGGTPVTADPSFSLEDGIYNTPQTLNLSSSTSGATIYYTTDGTEPTTSSSVYSGPISVNKTMTVKALAVKDGVESNVSSASYILKAATPYISPASCTFVDNQQVSIYCSGTPEASIYYTTDGSTPSVSSTPYSGPFTVDATTTVKAIATYGEMDNSDMAEATYTLKTIADGVFVKAYNVSELSEGLEVIIVNENAEKTFGSQDTNNFKTETVEIDHSAAPYTAIPGEGATIMTLEGSAGAWYFKTPSGYLYAASSSSNHLKTQSNKNDNAKATISFSSDGDATIQFQGTYTRNLLKYNSSNTLFSCYASGQQSVQIYYRSDLSTLEAPTITPASGTYTSAQTVSITNNAEGATLYYTTDGTTPTAASTAYTKPVVLSKNGTYTVKAIAIGDEGKSRVVTHTYTIDIDIDAPVFTENNGTTFNEPYTIHLTAADGCHIYYATGSASPVDDMGSLTSSAILYNGGIANISKATTITAVAVDAYGNVSHTATASYNYTGEVEVPFYENFDQGLGNFTVESTGTTPPEWVFRTNDLPADIERYGEARRYAFVTGNNNKRGTARLISPIIDLSDETVTSATLNFIHAGRYFDGYNSDNQTVAQTAAGQAPDHAQLFVREVGGAWQQLEIPNWFTQNSQYTRFNSGDIDLSAFAGKKIQVSFLYTADTQSTGTWNVLKFAVTTTNEEIVNMNTDGYVTYVVKNDIDWSQTIAKYHDVHGYKVTEFGREEAVFVEFGVGSNETMIPAETPIILKGKQGDNHLVIAKSDDVISKPKNNLLKPSYGEVKVAAGQQLFVFQKDKDWSAETPYDKYGFYRLSANRLIPERKAYLNAIDATEQVSGKTNMARGVYRLKDMGRLANAILGDVNGDGLVDVNDVMGVVSDVCGEKPETYIEEAADVNGDEDIDVNDVMKIVDTITDDKQQ